MWFELRSNGVPESTRPRIVGIVRKPGSTAIGGVLTDGRAKLPFVKTDEAVITGKEARAALAKGNWLPGQRVHNCFKSPHLQTVPDGPTFRRLIIVEFNFDDDRSEYVVVSQAAKREGYAERFKLEDPLIGDWFLIWDKMPEIRDLKKATFDGKLLFADIDPPTYDFVTEAVRLARKFHHEDKFWGQFPLSHVMMRAMTGW